tara:strand:- start:55 stop:177 length:123 start_codon:yes stop_codon:yes gene_type:complete
LSTQLKISMSLLSMGFGVPLNILSMGLEILSMGLKKLGVR